MRNPSSSSGSSKPQAAANSGAAVGSSSTSNKTTQCCSKVGLKRYPWRTLLATYIKKEGEGRRRTLPKKAGLLRCCKSCRHRWMNYLRPSVKRGHIAPDEEDLILRLHRLLGNRWSLIAGRIPGRTDNEIKNYWNTHLSKKLISQGIDPRTHKPLETNSKFSINDNKANHIFADPSSSTHFEPSRPVLIKDGGNGCTNTPTRGNICKPDDQYYQNAETTVGKDVVNMQNADDGFHMARTSQATKKKSKALVRSSIPTLPQAKKLKPSSTLTFRKQSRLGIDKGVLSLDLEHLGGAHNDLNTDQQRRLQILKRRSFAPCKCIEPATLDHLHTAEEGTRIVEETDSSTSASTMPLFSSLETQMQQMNTNYQRLEERLSRMEHHLSQMTTVMTAFFQSASPANSGTPPSPSA